MKLFFFFFLKDKLFDIVVKVREAGEVDPPFEILFQKQIFNF
jgi:hypothetical protein